MSLAALHFHDELIFSRRLTPYRSLTPREARTVILAFCGVTFVISLPFFFMGAWPVAGFMGLDALALAVAFRICFRSARAYETVELTPFELTLARVEPAGARREWRMNPSWVRLEVDADEETGTERVVVRSRGESVEIGAFLGPDQKAELARDLGRALATARGGARFS